MKKIAPVVAFALMIGAISAPAARADPDWDPELSAYMVGVPSSLLVAIGEANGDGATAAAFGAVAANTALAPPIVPPAPAAPPVFSPPVTPPLDLQVGGILLAGGLVFEVGTGIAKAVGVDYESLCGGTVPVVDQTLAALTLTDCTTFLQSEELQENLNADQRIEPSGQAMGSTSCDPTGKCAQIIALTPATSNEQDAGYCLKSVGITRFTNEVAVSYAGGWWGGAGWQSGPGPLPWSQCPGGFSSSDQLSWISALPNYQIATTWAATIQGAGNPTALPTPTRLDPLRSIRCVVDYAEGGSDQAETGQFRESDGYIPRPVCPALNPAKTPMTIRVYLITGTQVLSIGSVSVLTDFLNWADTYPTCRGGQCSLDLLKDDYSCFSDPLRCEGWVDDPDRDSRYECQYAGVAQSISECFIYGPLFDSANRDSGHGYGDPSSGDLVDPKTSPTDVDRVVGNLLTLHAIDPSDWGSYLPQTDPVAAMRSIAKQCLALADLPGSSISRVACIRAPRIFAPGLDVHEAAVNDFTAITLVPAWFRVDYMTGPEKLSSGVNPGWYGSCGATPGVQQCDEYPFYTTLQGGPGNGFSPPGWVAPIKKEHNVLEGNLWGGFAYVCNIAASPDREVLVVPMPGDDAPNTWGFCGL